VSFGDYTPECLYQMHYYSVAACFSPCCKMLGNYWAISVYMSK